MLSKRGYLFNLFLTPLIVELVDFETAVSPLTSALDISYALAFGVRRRPSLLCKQPDALASPLMSKPTPQSSTVPTAPKHAIARDRARMLGSRLGWTPRPRGPAAGKERALARKRLGSALLDESPGNRAFTGPALVSSPDGLKVRRDATLDSDPVGKLKSGTRVLVKGDWDRNAHPEGGRARVQLAGPLAGWVTVNMPDGRLLVHQDARFNEHIGRLKDAYWKQGIAAYAAQRERYQRAAEVHEQRAPSSRETPVQSPAQLLRQKTRQVVTSAKVAKAFKTQADVSTTDDVLARLDAALGPEA